MSSQDESEDRTKVAETTRERADTEKRDERRYHYRPVYTVDEGLKILYG